MLLDPSGKLMGMDTMLPYFQSLPFAEIVFQDFTFSGYALLIINGLTNLIAAGLLLAKKRVGVIAGGIFGVTLMLWICIQFYMFPLNFMSTAFFVIGFCQAATGYAAWVFYRQEQFNVQESDYPNIGTNPKRLVVYFSRMGYVKKQAMEEANRMGAALYEVRSTERTEGTLGFWWCGRYGMHRWGSIILSFAVFCAGRVFSAGFDHSPDSMCRIRSIRRRCSRKLFSLRMAMPCSSSPRISRLSPGCMSNIFRAFAGMTICPLSPTFTMPKTCFPLGGTSNPKFSRSVFSWFTRLSIETPKISANRLQRSISGRDSPVSLN